MSKTGFNTDFFTNNRKRLRKLIRGNYPIVMVANGLLQKTRDDDAYPFQQESNFWYLTGINEPDLILVIDKEDEYLILSNRNERTLIFSEQPQVSQLKKISGVDKIYKFDEGWKLLNKRLKPIKKFAGLAEVPRYDYLYDIFTNPAQRWILHKLKLKNKHLELSDISSKLAGLRTIKQEQEIAAIEQAIEHTAKIYAHISSNFKQYKFENEIRADIASYMYKNNLDLAFEPIIANGKNAITLHYKSNNARVNQNDITLLDLGFRFNGYCADLTRSLCLKPTKRQKQVYGAVLAIQKYAISQLKSEVIPIDYEKAVARFAGQKLRELGLIKKIDNESVHKYYKHRTSHFLGVDVHDEGDYSKPFGKGMVLTVEPGIYIKEENIGIRIEDDVIVNEKGVRVLSERLSREIDSITIK